MFNNLLANTTEIESSDIKFISQSSKIGYYKLSLHFNTAYSSYFYIIKPKRGLKPNKWSALDTKVILYLYNLTKYPVFVPHKNHSYKQLFLPAV